MYKNHFQLIYKYYGLLVSILVLMDLCIKTFHYLIIQNNDYCFNPCFNGSMYKNTIAILKKMLEILVSILVLMDLCIKTYLKRILRIR